MGHIRETTDDKMDWKFFYSYNVPKDISDAAWRKLIGNRGWEIIHGAIDNYPCSLCRESGSRLFHGIHDVVNIHIGKQSRYPDDLIFLKEGVDSALAKVQQKLNSSSPKVSHLQMPPMVVRHG
jgi:hypothetical protein